MDLSEIVFTEKFNKKTARLILKNKKTIKLKSPTEFTKLSNFVKNNGCVKYNYSKTDKGKICRLYGNGLQSLSKIIRGAISHEYYYDIDIVNCICHIIKYIAIDKEIKTPKLDNYIINREKILKKIMELKNINREKAKLFMICLINNSMDNTEDIDDNNFMDYLILLKNELSELRKVILSDEKYRKIILKYYNSNKIKQKKNKEISDMCIIIQYIENKILRIICDFINKNFDNNCLKSCSLIFDGLLFPKKYIPKNKLNKLISSMEKYINNKMNVGINNELFSNVFRKGTHNFFKLKIKEMKKINIIDKLENKKKNKDKDISKIEFFHFNNFKNKEVENEEDNIIEWFNETCKYVVNGGNVLVFTKNKCINQLNSQSSKIDEYKYDIKKLKKFNQCLSDCKMIIGYNKKGEPVYDDFDSIIKLFIKDSKLKIYKGTMFYPYLENNENINLMNKENFNLFTKFKYNGRFNSDNEKKLINGFIYKHIYKNINDFITSPLYCQDLILDINKKIFNYVNPSFEKSLLFKHIDDIICNNEPHKLEYVLNYVAHMIQKPDEIPETGIILYSNIHGIGKNLFAEIFLSKLIGRKYVSIYKNGEGFFNKFNTSQMNKLLIIFDELKGNNSDFIKNHTFLKAILTNNKINIEPKGMESFEINNYSRYFFISNNKHIVYIEPSDRRFVCLECNSNKILKMTKNEKELYFTSLFSSINNDEFLEICFEYFKKRNIKNWHPRKIINTKLKKQMMKFNMKNVYVFLIDFIEAGSSYEINGDEFMVTKNDLWREYKYWCDFSNERESKIKTFEENLSLISINKIKCRKRNKYRDQIIFKGSFKDIEKNMSLMFNDDFKFNISN